MSEPDRPVMHDSDTAALAAQLEAWEKNEVASFLARQPERAQEFRTLGGLPLKRVYTPLDLMSGVNRESNAYAKGVSSDDALRLVTNIITYALSN